MTKKIKVLTISDHPLSPSGVGTQTKYVCQSLLESGKFEIFSLGGAIKHKNYDLVNVDPYGNDWKIFPVDGYGSQELIRSILRNEKPDIVWIMTDPRFYGWLWNIENEIRPLCPIVYYHVWDNYPYPMFNKKYYDSNDYIACISKLTHDIVKNVAPEVNSCYIPHAVDEKVFTYAPPEQRKKIREKLLPKEDQDKLIFLWNNRNARRKQSGTVVWWFNEWMEENSLHDKVKLIMHTDPNDNHGQDLVHIVEHLGLKNNEISFSTDKLNLEDMFIIYHLADCTINISDAEGFGLATLESLSCGTPIIATMTGGLQEQVISPEGECGVPIFPTSKSIIGSQSVPYIYEDRISASHFKAALNKIYNMSTESRIEMGKLGKSHVNNNYNFENFRDQWVRLMVKVHKEQGSWDTRKKSNNIRFREVA
jgi:glycosyltransferase involved in cell wall biosynthesis